MWWTVKNKAFLSSLHVAIVFMNDFSIIWISFIVYFVLIALCFASPFCSFCMATLLHDLFVSRVADASPPWHADWSAALVRLSPELEHDGSGGSCRWPNWWNDPNSCQHSKERQHPFRPARAQAHSQHQSQVPWVAMHYGHVLFSWCIIGLSWNEQLKNNHCLFFHFHFICLSIFLSVCLSVHIFTHLSILSSIHPSIHLSIHPSIYLSIHLSIHLSIYLSIYLFFSIYGGEHILYDSSLKGEVQQ